MTYLSIYITSDCDKRLAYRRLLYLLVNIYFGKAVVSRARITNSVEFTDIGDTHRSSLCEVSLQKVIDFEVCVIRSFSISTNACEEWVDIHGGMRHERASLYIISLIRIDSIDYRALTDGVS